MSPLSAHAAVVATDLSTQVAVNAALRTLKSSQKKLLTLEVTMDMKDYAVLKEAFRVLPMSELRRSCGTILKTIPIESNTHDSFSNAYKTMVTALESLDSTASLALRGRDITPEVFRDKYQATVQAMQVLVEAAEQVTSA
jgi:hypothetical protein